MAAHVGLVLRISTVWLLAALTAGPTVLRAQEEMDAAGKKLLAASGYYDRGLYKPAAQEFAEFLAQYPKHAQATNARYGLAVCRYRLADYGQAAKLLGDLLKDKSFTKRDEALAVLAHCHIQLKQYEPALAALDEMASRHSDSPHFPAAANNRIQVLYFMGRKDRCLAAAQQFLAKFPDSGLAPAARYYEALALAGLDRHEEAAASLQKLLGEKANLPFEGEALLLWGQCLEKQNKLAEACELYKRLARISPSRGTYSLGLALYRMGKFADSAAALRPLASKSDDPLQAQARLQLGLSLLADKKTSDARALLKDIAAGDTARSAAAGYALAQCDIADSKYEPALAILDKLLQAKPANSIDLLRDRAFCLMKLEKYDPAAAAYDAYRQAAREQKDPPVQPDDLAQALYHHAFCLHKLGKYEASNTLCQQVPADSALATSAGELTAENFFLLGKNDQAAQALARMAQSATSEPQKLRYALRLGQCAYLDKNFEQAVGHLKTVVESRQAAEDPALREALFLMGDCLLQLNKPEEAAKVLDRYCKLSKTPRDEALYKLAAAQARAEDFDDADKTLQRLAKLPADSPWVQRGLLDHAQILYNRKQAKKAAPVLAALLAAKPADDLHAQALYLQGWIDFDARSFDSAAAKFASLAGQFPKHALAGDARYQQALALKEAGKNEQAVALLEGYLKDFPQGAHAQNARQLIGASLAQMGKGDEAVKRLSAMAADRSSVSEQVLYQLAWAQRRTDQKDAAAATYRRMLTEYADGKMAIAARAELGDLLLALDKHAEAAAVLEQCLAAKDVEPALALGARYRLGACYAKLDQHDKAAAAFLAFAEASDDAEMVPSALYQAAVCLAQCNKFADARKPLATLLAKYPRHELTPAAQLKLGEVLAETGNYEPSAEAYQAYLQKFPKDKFVHLAQFGLGWSLENRKQYDQARAWYQKVIAAHNGPTAARAQFQIGETYLAQQDFEKAAAELLKVDIVYAYPEWSSRALLEAGTAFRQLKQFDQARQQWTLCTTKYKDRPEAALARKYLDALAKESK